MSVECIRKLTRYIVSGTLVGFSALVVFGLVRHEPMHHHDLWGGLGVTILVLGFWGWIEVTVKAAAEAADRVVAAQPATKAIVAHTLRALEEEREAAEAAHLPRIADYRSR